MSKMPKRGLKKKIKFLILNIYAKRIIKLIDRLLILINEYFFTRLTYPRY